MAQKVPFSYRLEFLLYSKLQPHAFESRAFSDAAKPIIFSSEAPCIVSSSAISFCSRLPTSGLLQSTTISSRSSASSGGTKYTLRNSYWIASSG